MAASGGGRIVNVTSVHATNSERGAIAYDAAKGGLDAATRTLARELGAHGVLVNSIAPGFVRTRMSQSRGADELETDWFRDSYITSGRIPVGRAAGRPRSRPPSLTSCRVTTATSRARGSSSTAG